MQYDACSVRAIVPLTIRIFRHETLPVQRLHRLQFCSHIPIRLVRRFLRLTRLHTTLLLLIAHHRSRKIIGTPTTHVPLPQYPKIKPLDATTHRRRFLTLCLTRLRNRAHTLLSHLLVNDAPSASAVPISVELESVAGSSVFQRRHMRIDGIRAIKKLLLALGSTVPALPAIVFVWFRFVIDAENLEGNFSAAVSQRHGRTIWDSQIEDCEWGKWLLVVYMSRTGWWNCGVGVAWLIRLCKKCKPLSFFVSCRSPAFVRALISLRHCFSYSPPYHRQLLFSFTDVFILIFLLLLLFLTEKKILQFIFIYVTTNKKILVCYPFVTVLSLHSFYYFIQMFWFFFLLQ